MRFLFLYFVILLLAFRWPIFSTEVVATEKEAINIGLMCPSSSVFRIHAHFRIESEVKVYVAFTYFTWLSLSIKMPPYCKLCFLWAEKAALRVVGSGAG